MTFERFAFIKKFPVGLMHLIFRYAYLFNHMDHFGVKIPDPVHFKILILFVEIFKHPPGMEDNSPFHTLSLVLGNDPETIPVYFLLVFFHL